MKWSELMTNLFPQRVKSSLTALESLIDDVNSAQVNLLGYSNLNALLYELEVVLCQKPLEQSMWKDLLIYTSSYKDTDCRYVQLLIQKLYEYAGFYNKVLTDEGVQRHLVYAKDYSNQGQASSTERATDSVTPQNSNLYSPVESTADTLFDEAIANFASGINKNKASSSSSSSGDSTTTVTGTTWEEQKKNLQMLFYNELCDYIMSIPERIYAYYSIDSVPVPELCKLFCQHMKEVMEIFNTDE